MNREVEMKKLTTVLCLLGLAIFGFTDSEAKRDPFKVFFELDPSGKKEELTPLERYEISELKLIGIIGSKSQGYRALVEDKAGAGFILTEGTLVGSGGSKVNEIRRDKVIIREKYRDYMGRQKVRKVVWTLHTPASVSSQGKRP
jgi:Tfp pilus assembly protein PilP